MLGDQSNAGEASFTLVASRLALLSITSALFLALAASALGHHKSGHESRGGGKAGGTADMAVTLTDSPDPVEVGQLLTYTARLANDGPKGARNVTLSDRLPATVRFVSATGNRGASCGLSGATVTCRLSRLKAGHEATVSIVVRPSAAGTLTNSVSVSADQADPASQNNRASTSTTVAAAPQTDSDPGGCSGNSWFVGIVYDEEERHDFTEDIAHFERFADGLGKTHCIPADQSTILAYGKGYEEASEANLKVELQDIAKEANKHNDSQLFFFLSSHGNASSGLLSAIGASACGPTRVVGSYAALQESSLEESPGEDGFLDDCELGAELSGFKPSTRMFVAVDCSFCGGFSDSLTAASGTVPDGGLPESSGVPGTNRVVITGCAVTTECFGSRNGGNLYRHMNGVLSDDVAGCDGWTAPAFPQVQGADVPVRGATDGRCTASEWFFASVNRAYTQPGEIGNFEHHIDHVLSIQQQFRIKYGFDSLDEDVLIR